MSLTRLFREIEQQEWIDLPEGWLQGRTIFGGLAAGVLMHKALCTIGDESKRLLSCSITFVGPVQAGKARITAEILRQGKSVTTLEVRLWQENAVQSILIASFGTDRESSIHVRQEPVIPAYPFADQLAPLPFAKMMPECFKHAEYTGWPDISQSYKICQSHFTIRFLLRGKSGPSTKIWTWTSHHWKFPFGPPQVKMLITLRHHFSKR